MVFVRSSLSQTISILTLSPSLTVMTVSLWPPALPADVDAVDGDDEAEDVLRYFLWTMTIAASRMRHRREAHRMAWWRVVAVLAWPLLSDSSRCRISLIALSPSFICHRSGSGPASAGSLI